MAVSAPAAAPHAAIAWTLRLRVAVAGKPYARMGYRLMRFVVNRAGVPVATFRGTPTAAGKYSVPLVFPSAGSRRYVVVDPVMGEWDFPTLRVAA